MSDVALEHSPGGEGAGKPGHQNIPDFEKIGNKDSVHRSGAAKSDQSKLSWVNPFAHSKRANGIRHFCINHITDPFGHLLHI